MEITVTVINTIVVTFFYNYLFCVGVCVGRHPHYGACRVCSLVLASHHVD